MTLTDAKLYLRVDGTADDALITGLITAAAKYIDGQTGKTQVKTGEDEAGEATYGPIAADALYITAQKLMIAHWYENRGVEVVGATVARFSHSVDALVNHIATCGDYI
jgi:uncharacterized phage protein (predicted DNA packaging)